MKAKAAEENQKLEICIDRLQSYISQKDYIRAFVINNLIEKEYIDIPSFVSVESEYKYLSAQIKRNIQEDKITEYPSHIVLETDYERAYMG